MRKHDLLPGLFFVGGALLIGLLAVASRRAEFEHVQLQTDITAEQVALRMESCINTRANLVSSLSNQGWLGTQQLLDEWQFRASTLHPLYASILALNYVDNNGVIRVVYPMDGNEVALNADLRRNSNPSVPRALAEALQSGELVRTDVVELLQGGMGVAFYKRITAPDDNVLGLVNGVFRLNQLLDNCLSEEPLRSRFGFQLSQNGNDVIYRQPASGLQLHPDYTVATEVNIVGEPWLLEFSPSELTIGNEGASLDALWLVVAFVLVLLLAGAYRSLLLKQLSLAESQRSYRLLVENQSDMVVKVNPAGELLYVSPSYCRVFGKSEVDLLGRKFMPLVHEEDRDRTLRSFMSVQQPPYHSYHEQRALTREGWRWMAWSNTALLDAEGKVEAITGVGRDVTDVKQLEARVAQSQKMQAIGQMAGGISHDFNNLLQVMLSNVEFLLQRRGKDAELRDELGQVIQAIERAMTLTGRLATLSRQEKSVREVVEVNAFVASLQVLLRRTLPARIALVAKPAGKSLHVEADRTQLEQVLLNLCFNARDAISDEGCITITVEPRHLQQTFAGGGRDVVPGDYACISIADNGSGMSEDVVARVFEPFFTTKEGKGTGLGLANCYSIIQQHQGEIRVESTVGHGSVFTLWLPLVRAEEQQQASQVQLADASFPATDEAPLLLVVDDDADVLRLTCAMLELAGYRTVSAANGNEAVLRMQQLPGQISLVVMDLLMPGLNGQQAAEQIATLAPETPVLFMSGYIPQGRDAVKGPLLRKPFTGSSLLQAVRALLQRS